MCGVQLINHKREENAAGIMKNGSAPGITKNGSAPGVTKNGSAPLRRASLLGSPGRPPGGAVRKSSSRGTHPGP